MSEDVRIVSLLPSATEMVCAVGARGMLVGVSHECDFPGGVGELPVLTRARQTLPSSSAGIDRSIRQMLADAIAIYEVDLDLLRDLDPQIIVTQDLCEVCALPLDTVEKAMRELGRSDVEIVSLQPTRLRDVWNDLRRVGDAVGLRSRGEEEAAKLEARCDAIAKRAEAADSLPTVLTIEWLDPIMVGGTWMPELIALGGGQPMVTLPGQPGKTLTPRELRELDPDVVLIKPCGFDIARTQSEAGLFAKNLPWERWRAVREGRIFVADGNAFFNRSGPRLVESLEILAACLHPSLFRDMAERRSSDYRQITPDIEFHIPCESKPS